MSNNLFLTEGSIQSESVSVVKQIKSITIFLYLNKYVLDRNLKDIQVVCDLMTERFFCAPETKISKQFFDTIALLFLNQCLYYTLI